MRHIVQSWAPIGLTLTHHIEMSGLQNLCIACSECGDVFYINYTVMYDRGVMYDTGMMSNDLVQTRRSEDISVT